MEYNLPMTGFVRLPELIGSGKPLPFSRSTIFSWVAEGTFPAPVKIGKRISAWRVEDIRAFIATAGEVK